MQKQHHQYIALYQHIMKEHTNSTSSRTCWTLKVKLNMFWKQMVISEQSVLLPTSLRLISFSLSLSQPLLPVCNLSLFSTSIPSWPKYYLAGSSKHHVNQHHYRKTNQLSNPNLQHTSPWLLLRAWSNLLYLCMSSSWFQTWATRLSSSG